MFYTKFLILLIFFALITTTMTIRVDMSGKLTFGRDVARALRMYFGTGHGGQDTRRRFKPTGDMVPNTLPYIVKSHTLCEGLPFCVGKRGAFIEEYIIHMTDKLEDLLSPIIQDVSYKHTQSTIVFEKPLLKCLSKIRNLLETSDNNIRVDKESNVWVDTIKGITSIFHSTAMQFLSDLFIENAVKPDIKKKKEIEKLVITIARIESDYEGKLCIDYNICTNSFICTRFLESVFNALSEISDEKLREFIKQFTDALPVTTVLYNLDEKIASEFQHILSEMTFNKQVQTGEIISSVGKAVAARIAYVETNKPISSQKIDVQLINAILSDMDYILMTDKSDQINQFIPKFFVWVERGGKMTGVLKSIMTAASDIIGKYPRSLVSKLTHETRVFMELTIGPEESN